MYQTPEDGWQTPESEQWTARIECLLTSLQIFLKTTILVPKKGLNGLLTFIFIFIVNF